MKKKGYILSVVSLTLGLIFLAGSTGVTVITHSCSHCNDFSIKTGIFLPPSLPQDNCCEYANVYNSKSSSCKLEEECCHFSIGKLQLVDYSPSLHIDAPAPKEAPYQNPVDDFFYSTYIINSSFTVHNKHGGRYLITSFCQLIS